MLKRINALYEYTVEAEDGEVGSVQDIYFDDQAWDVRYLVVRTGTWLSSRDVLVSPCAIGEVGLAVEVLPVDLTRSQVENSPEIDVAQPVSQQELEDLHRYYGWPWHAPQMAGPQAAARVVYHPSQTLPAASMPPTSANESPLASSAKEELRAAMRGPQDTVQDPYLRSCREVEGYEVQAQDSACGSVQDFLIDVEAWAIRYLVVKTGAWLAGRQVLIAPAWVDRVLWSESEIYADLTCEAIREGPEYDPNERIGRDYEMVLHKHYERRGYWEFEDESAGIVSG